MTTLTIGTTIRRLNHLEYPAFEKMNQNGMTIKTTKIRQMISPYIGIISDMAFILRMVFRYLPPPFPLHLPPYRVDLLQESIDSDLVDCPLAE